MPDFQETFSMTLDSLPGAVSDVDDAYPTDVDTVTATQVQVRITGTELAGTYILGLSSTSTIDSTNNAVFSRYTLDASIVTPVWEEASRSAANSGDNLFFTYSFPIIHAGGVFDFALQMKKESNLNTLAVPACSIWFHRVG